MSEQYNGNDYVKDYLEHHGVKGQKWGVRRMDEKLQMQRKKTKIAELKALESAAKYSGKSPKQQAKEESKASKEKTKAGVKNGKKITLAILGTAAFSSLVVAGIIKHQRKQYAKGAVATKKILKKGGVTRRSFHM